ncbi:glycerol-3-phosphate acyltransferase [Mycoplasmopsis anatis]|uniref:glycerol-3-phosphate 1-O-acyltransferase PlsY n=1 Tax=Mycoplasmopsis anatis TaxID=171279 RepID=UPI001C4DF577|nr:glycerol-3-phosphate 1-O-acyltransferase PlsY [Mycoplasmopsis anatis]MBW0594952.1 glycerol-3-phosphate acyltransferase [Mycoplasmopsis anatis]MBW0595533.1 glycerol-3-phosphate acyltransferase [Mycoplasmopsis anatis]MBW0595805.1 glycerol-3-phosphate acyltransferase [Mycoplasmopsis anatis]MBW0596709.1 glycerol-3-phosphate acyltransferase [Mycoplasmopsis anatis]MBW0597277.1 glycerol-3-phosphate acyltransferase [Mycoplasmopsis anatis]
MKIFIIVLINLFIFIVGYLVGSVNTSIVLSHKRKSQDIRDYNSKNAGATNSLRTYGGKFALAVLIIDILKSYLTVMIFSLLTRYISATNTYLIIPMLAGVGVVIGHVYPIFYKFKGGKGAACSLGVLIAINPLNLFISAFIFFSVIFITRYVSLASMLTAFLMVFVCFCPWIAHGILAVFKNNAGYFYIEGICFTLCALLLIYAHRSNIVRLINGTERKQKLSRNK